MKNVLLLTLCLLVFKPVDMYAQPVQERKGALIGPPRDATAYGEDDKPTLHRFPDIPGLRLEQRADIGAILTKEWKVTDMLTEKKRKLIAETEQKSFSTEKEQAKFRKNIERIDLKIEQQKDKSNKKIKKILSEEQYRIFIEKRADFEFRKEPPARFDGAPDARRPGGRGRPPGGSGGPGGGRGRP